MSFRNHSRFLVDATIFTNRNWKRHKAKTRICHPLCNRIFQIQLSTKGAYKISTNIIRKLTRMELKVPKLWMDKLLASSATAMEKSCMETPIPLLTHWNRWLLEQQLSLAKTNSLAIVDILGLPQLLQRSSMVICPVQQLELVVPLWLLSNWLFRSSKFLKDRTQ